MDKLWLNQYQAGIPKEIDPSAYSSLPDLFVKPFAKYPNHIAFSNMGTDITYKELDKLSKHFAAYLQYLCLKKGARVAIMMPNLLQYSIAIFGILRAGMSIVNINPLYTAAEVSEQLSDCS